VSSIEKPLRRSEAAEILDYRDKYVARRHGLGARELPAQLAPGQRELVERSARTIAEVAASGARSSGLPLECERTVRERDQHDSGSLSKYLFVDPPVSFATLLTDLIAEAIERPATAQRRRRRRLVLRSAVRSPPNWRNRVLG